MKQRVIEVLFRHIFLLLLPLIVILPVTAWLTLRSRTVQWQSAATAWVNQPSTISTDNRLGSTPAPSQATLLQNFIDTHSFAHAVLAQTPLASELDGGARENAAITAFQHAVTVTPNGNSFVTIAVKENAPDLAYAVAQAVIGQFAQQIQQETTTESQSSVELAQTAYNKANAQFTSSLNALATYLAQHPEIAAAASNTSGAPVSQSDPAYAQLLAQADSDRQAYDAAKQKYDDAKQQAQAGSTALPFTFTLVDQPEKPTVPIAQKKTALLKLPAIGLAAALTLSTLVGIYLMLADRRIFGPDDLESLDVTVLGALPDLGSRWRRGNRDVVRWRIAAPARADQPSAPSAPPPPPSRERGEVAHQLAQQTMNERPTAPREPVAARPAASAPAAPMRPAPSLRELAGRSRSTSPADSSLRLLAHTGLATSDGNSGTGSLRAQGDDIPRAAGQ